MTRSKEKENANCSEEKKKSIYVQTYIKGEIIVAGTFVVQKNAKGSYLGWWKIISDGYSDLQEGRRTLEIINT